MSLGGFIVVGNGDAGTLGHYILVTEVLTVGDVGKEEEVWVSTLIENLEPEVCMTAGMQLSDTRGRCKHK